MGPQNAHIPGFLISYMPYRAQKIEELIKNNSTIYDMFADKRANKYKDESRKQLEKFEINKLPLYIQKNLNKFKDWVD